MILQCKLLKIKNSSKFTNYLLFIPLKRLAKMTGPSIDKFKGVSERNDALIEEMNKVLNRFN